MAYCASGSGQEVEGGGRCRTEADRDGLGVVRINRHRGVGQDGIHRNRTALGFVNRTAADDAVGIQLEGCTTLLALEHVFDHAVSKSEVVISHVHRARAGAITETSDVVFEGDVLTRGLTDGGDVDLSAGNVKSPVADLTHHSKIRVVSLEFVGADSRALGGDRDHGTAEGGGNSQSASGSGVADDVVDRASGDTSRQGASRSATSLVDNAEFDGIANFEIEVGADAQDGSSSGDISRSEAGGGASGLVVESAGRAGQNSSGHGDVPRGLSSGAGTARLLLG